MAISQPAEYLHVLKKIHTWVPAQRLALARQILQSLEDENTASSTRRTALADLLGLLKVEGPPPTDDDCRRLLEEELLRKYGA